MEKIIEYKVLAEYIIEDLEEKVMEYLEKGYKLYGSPTYGENWYIQAVIKIEERD